MKRKSRKVSACETIVAIILSIFLIIASAPAVYYMSITAFPPTVTKQIKLQCMGNGVAKNATYWIQTFDEEPVKVLDIGQNVVIFSITTRSDYLSFAVHEYTKTGVLRSTTSRHSFFIPAIYEPLEIIVRCQ